MKRLFFCEAIKVLFSRTEYDFNFFKERFIFNDADVTNTRDFFKEKFKLKKALEFFFSLHHPASFYKKNTYERTLTQKKS